MLSTLHYTVHSIRCYSSQIHCKAIHASLCWHSTSTPHILMAVKNFNANILQ